MSAANTRAFRAEEYCDPTGRHLNQFFLHKLHTIFQVTVDNPGNAKQHVCNTSAAYDRVSSISSISSISRIRKKFSVRTVFGGCDEKQDLKTLGYVGLAISR